jgi:hypothetical protein
LRFHHRTIFNKLFFSNELLKLMSCHHRESIKANTKKLSWGEGVLGEFLRGFDFQIVEDFRNRFQVEINIQFIPKRRKITF